MKALARFGKAFGGYKMIDVPQPKRVSEASFRHLDAAAKTSAPSFAVTPMVLPGG